METKSLHAHFDGERIVLDEPFELKPDDKLIVTVLPNNAPDAERGAWLELSKKGLERAYGENEPEYTADMIKKANPAYEPR